MKHWMHNYRAEKDFWRSPGMDCYHTHATLTKIVFLWVPWMNVSK
jgi:hypothetical protein